MHSHVVAIADGFSRASGRLVACNVHVAPGLGNAMGSLYNASFTGTPMILTAGQQEQGHGLMEPVLYDPLVRIAEPLVKWAVEVTRLEDLPRIQLEVREILAPHDLMIVLGGDPLRMSVYSEVDPLPAGLPMVQIGLVDWDLAKNYAAEIALKTDVKETLRALIPALKTLGGAAIHPRAREGIAALKPKNWTARRAALVEQISKNKNRSPIDPDFLTLQLVEAMPGNAILVDEGLTSSRQVTALRPHRDRYGYHALASGGIGWGLPAAVGASMANPDRPVVC